MDIVQTILPVLTESKIHSVTIIDSRPLTPTTHAIRVVKPVGFEFRASSFVRMSLETEAGVDRRPMSIASAPTRDYLEWAVRLSDSTFKRAFVLLKPGDTIQVEGPRGRFFLDPKHPAILIAGGIGITPFKSMIEFAADANLATPITLVYSNRARDEIVFKEELEELAHANRHFRIVHTLTRPAGNNWQGRVGRIDMELLQQLATNSDARYYICGTPDLVANTTAMLSAMGIASEKIFVERFKGYAREVLAPRLPSLSS